MAEYTVYFSTNASCSVTVDDDDLDQAMVTEYGLKEILIERAYELVPGGLCAQCSGWGSDVGVDLSGEWDVDEELYKDGEPFEPDA